MLDQEKIKEQIQKLLELLGAEGSVAIEDRSGKLVFNIRSPDSRILIGQYGNSLIAFQHILRLLVRKEKSEEDQRLDFIIDIEDYRKNREGYLEELARQAAERVRETKQPLTLKPMNSYDRYIIHSYLTSSEDLMTESTGEGEERRVVITPKEG